MAKRKKVKKIRPYALVRYDFETMSERCEEWVEEMPFRKKGKYIFLGEILQMPGHGIFVDIRDGHMYAGYHMDEFIELTDEEC
jgi:hypothetical protein